MINRRNFIKSTIFSLIFPNLLEVSLPEENSSFNLFDKFPDKIPGAGEIRKFKTPNSKYFLTHIFQVHEIAVDYSNFATLLRTYQDDDDKERVNNCQRDIYNILEYLIANVGLKEVYHEGLTESTLVKLINNRDMLEEIITFNSPLHNDVGMLKRNIRIFNGQEYISPGEIPEGKTGVQYMEELMSEINKKEVESAKIKEEMKFFHGAPLRLLYEDKIKVLTFEDPELLTKAKKEAIKEDNIGYNALDARENILIEKISQRDNELVVVVLGGAHAFGGKDSFGENYSLEKRRSYEDNIHVWNEKHPDKKFSLIEIIPETLKGDYGE